MSSEKPERLCMVCGKRPRVGFTPDGLLWYCMECFPYVLFFNGNTNPTADDFEQFRLAAPGAWPFDGSEGEAPGWVTQVIADTEARMATGEDKRLNYEKYPSPAFRREEY